MCRISEGEIRKEARLPSALLSLLSMQHARAALQRGEYALPLDAAPGGVQAHLLHQAAATVAVADCKPDSDAEYDDTDDIVLPEEGDAEPYYGGGFGALSPESGGAEGRRRDAGSEGDDVSRHFECRHCGKKYRWKSTLRRHENVECGGKAPAHQCPYCSYKAKQRGNLGVHIRKHHNTEWYMYATNKVRRNKKTSV